MDHIWMVVWMPAIISPKEAQDENEDIVAYLCTEFYIKRLQHIRVEEGDLRYGEYIYCKHYPSP